MLYAVVSGLFLSRAVNPILCSEVVNGFFRSLISVMIKGVA
jgi:hypothetical protein